MPCVPEIRDGSFQNDTSHCFYLSFFAIGRTLGPLIRCGSRGGLAEGAMSNFIVGIVAGFFLCVWALDASPVTAAVSLIDRIRQVEVSFAAEAGKSVARDEAAAKAD
jgi:hypothetical protein